MGCGVCGVTNHSLWGSQTWDVLDGHTYIRGKVSPGIELKSQPWTLVILKMEQISALILIRDNILISKKRFLSILITLNLNI